MFHFIHEAHGIVDLSDRCIGDRTKVERLCLSVPIHTNNHNNPTQPLPQQPKITTRTTPTVPLTPPPTLTFGKIASLDHEVLDDTVEGTPLEGQSLTGRCCFRRIAWRGGGEGGRMWVYGLR